MKLVKYYETMTDHSVVFKLLLYIFNYHQKKETGDGHYSVLNQILE